MRVMILSATCLPLPPQLHDEPGPYAHGPIRALSVDPDPLQNVLGDRFPLQFRGSPDKHVLERDEWDQEHAVLPHQACHEAGLPGADGQSLPLVPWLDGQGASGPAHGDPARLKRSEQSREGVRASAQDLRHQRRYGRIRRAAGRGRGGGSGSLGWATAVPVEAGTVREAGPGPRQAPTTTATRRTTAPRAIPALHNRPFTIQASRLLA